MHPLLFLVIILLGKVMNNEYTSESEAQHILNSTNPSHNEESMSAENIYHGDRIKWTEKMFVDLMLWEKQAYKLQDSDHCPRKDNRQKEGMMNLILQYWNNMGYQHLNLQ